MCRGVQAHWQNPELHYITFEHNISGFLHLNNDVLYYFSVLGWFSLPIHPGMRLLSAPNDPTYALLQFVMVAEEIMHSERKIFLQHHRIPSFLKNGVSIVYVENGGSIFRENGVIWHWKAFHHKNVAEYDHQETPVHFCCCWKQYIIFTQKMLRLQQKRYFQRYCSSNLGNVFSIGTFKNMAAGSGQTTHSILWCR